MGKLVLVSLFSVFLGANSSIDRVVNLGCAGLACAGSASPSPPLKLISSAGLGPAEGLSGSNVGTREYLVYACGGLHNRYTALPARTDIPAPATLTPAISAGLIPPAVGEKLKSDGVWNV